MSRGKCRALAVSVKVLWEGRPVSPLEGLEGASQGLGMVRLSLGMSAEGSANRGPWASTPTHCQVSVSPFVPCQPR